MGAVNCKVSVNTFLTFPTNSPTSSCIAQPRNKMADQVDYFAESMFVGRKIARDFNFDISNIFQETRDLLLAGGVIANVYLTGSLARKEPAIDMMSLCETPRLASDIDLVVATTDSQRFHKTLSNFSCWANSNWPHYDISVVFVPIEKLGDMRSCFAHDFSLGMKNPVFVAIEDVNAPPPKLLCLADVFETAIHQLSTFLIHKSHNRSSMLYPRQQAYRGASAVLEFIRGLSCTGAPCCRYSELWTADGTLLRKCNVTKREVVTAIRDRELFTGCFQESLLLPLARGIVSKFLFDSECELLTSVEIVHLLITQVNSDLISMFRIYVVAIACCLEEQSLVGLVTRLCREIADSLNLDALLRKTKLMLRRDEATLDHLIEFLCYFREEYLRTLHLRNLGWEMV